MDQNQIDHLIKKIIAGDAEAEQELYNSFKQEVEFIIKLKIGKTNPDWKDLHQEIFAAFFQRISDGQYDSTMGTLGAFLQSTIKYKIMDYMKSPAFKKRQNYCAIDDLKLETQNGNPSDNFIDNEERELLKQAITELDEPYKQILFFSIYKQLKVKEISEKLGLSEQKVSNLKSYALTLLKKKLEKYF